MFPIPLDGKHDLSDVFSQQSYHIICVAGARLYHAPFGSSHQSWTSSGLRGILVFGKDNEASDGGNGLCFRLVDLNAKGKVVWVHNIQKVLDYRREKPFFHTFDGASRSYGFRFEEDDEADKFFEGVSHMQRAIVAPTSYRKSKLRLSRRLSPSVVSPPTPGSFVHVSHITVDEKGFVGASENVNTNWLHLLGELKI